ncbi:hypothetical protein JIQ42_04297 [Leishmania sp. Namibia]|uniref:hypothetical protein n=1 Tax=Leishmania sp. Namibia TaxID=2802991 RepID=UPI001B4E8063|nr:hypothetical protein JIQ42_04297 [Leishmania sp. Namibia]
MALSVTQVVCLAHPTHPTLPFPLFLLFFSFCGPRLRSPPRKQPSSVLAAAERRLDAVYQLPSYQFCTHLVKREEGTRTRRRALIYIYPPLLFWLTSASKPRTLYSLLLCILVSISPPSSSLFPTSPHPSPPSPGILRHQSSSLALYMHAVMMTANSDDQLDALVDSILQSRDRPAITSQMPQRPSSQQQQEHASSGSRNSSVRASMYAVCPGGSTSSAADNFATVVPTDPRASASTSKTAPTHIDAGDEEAAEEEDLSVLIERILAGDGARGLPSTSATSSPNFSYVPPPHVGSSGPSRASRRGGATRVGGRSRSMSRMFGARDVSPDACTQGVVRRLALWYECKEAKRVQAVYEALEREQQKCTFEPNINRFEVGVGSSLVTDGEGHLLHRHRHSADEALHRPSATSKGRQGSGSRSVSFANTISMSSSSSRATPHMCDYIPSLQPPLQPITGADAFVERLRRAQEKRDAVREAEEAKRLHYYDPATFRRDPTVPVPFELGARPRRLLAETAAVVSARSPSPGGVVGVARASPPPLSPRAAALAAYSSAGATPPPPEEDVFRDVDEGKRLTPENTFLSLAPKIRQGLLFDRQMDTQLLRATDSIRRAAGGE